MTTQSRSIASHLAGPAHGPATAGHGLMAEIAEFWRTFIKAAFDPAGGNLVNIRALRDARVLQARYSDIRELYAKHEDFRVLSERGMQRRYQELCDRLEQMATLDAGGRYALFREAFGSLEADIPQYLVASYIGVTPTQLSRVRRKAGIG